MSSATDDRWELIAQAYRRDAARVSRRILALTGDPASVDDLVNETFVCAYEALEKFEGRSHFSTWLLGIATNVARAHRSKHRRRRRLDRSLPGADSCGTCGETHLREQRAVERLYAAVDELPGPQREAFVLCVLERCSLKDASAALGVPISTLHARRQRAEAHVRARLEEDPDES